MPSSAATKPSSVVAVFQITHGRLFCCAKFQEGFSAVAGSCSKLTSTAIPASCKVFTPPDIAWCGSVCAITTLVMPAAITACAHGPVLPCALHGSNVQYKVAPTALVPAWAIAITSACAVPLPSCQPSPIMLPAASTITAPTLGLTSRDKSTLPASSIARDIKVSEDISFRTTTRHQLHLVPLHVSLRLLQLGQLCCKPQSQQQMCLRQHRRTVR